MFREAVLKPSVDAPSPSRQQQQFKSPRPPATPPTVGEVGAAAELLRGVRQNSNNERKINRPLEIRKIPEAMDQAGHLPVKTKPAERSEVLDSVVFSEQQAERQVESAVEQQAAEQTETGVETVVQQVETAEQQVETAEQQVEPAEQQVEPAEQQVELAQRQVEPAEQQVELAEQQVEPAEQQVESGVQNLTNSDRLTEDGSPEVQAENPPRGKDGESVDGGKDQSDQPQQFQSDRFKREGVAVLASEEGSEEVKLSEEEL
jgi:hypothetical protein